MTSLLLFVKSAVFSILLVNGAVLDNGDVDQQGLYSLTDNVIVLTGKNFDRSVYGKNYAILVQFYNSFCGHCRAFAPKYKSVAASMVKWKKVVQPAVMDCSVPENLDCCRDFEVLAYPSVRYLHENYTKANNNVGIQIATTDNADTFKINIINTLLNEQKEGRLKQVFPLNILQYNSLISVYDHMPDKVLYTFLVFEDYNSTVGTELILHFSSYSDIMIKRVLDTSPLTLDLRIIQSHALVVVDTNFKPTILSKNDNTVENLVYEINSYLKSKGYDTKDKEDQVITPVNHHPDSKINDDDVVYYSDLEKTIRTILGTEITRYKNLQDHALLALIDFLNIMITVFPFRGNTRNYFVDLRNTLNSQNSWTGVGVQDTVSSLEKKHAPVYTTNSEYIGCLGSESKYRGYTCGLWTLFHVLTVNAAAIPGKEGPKVLKVMYDYVKYFFGCTKCAEHFHTMAIKNQIFDVTENDKAVLWLWISHNEVNLRLAGDETEDPYHPKIQFPSVVKCPKCRLPRGQWNLPSVYQYLQQMYSASSIRSPRTSAAPVGSSPFTNIDIGMLSFLYILSFAILILVVKFLTKGIYRRKNYKHDGWGKV